MNASTSLATAAALAATLATLVLIVVAWLWGPALWAAWRRERIRRQPFPRAWREVLRRRMPAFAQLPADVQLQLKKHAQVLIAEKPFIGCAGLEVTDEMRVLVATQAALLLLNRRAGGFPNLRQVLMYPGAFVVERVVPGAAGLAHETRRVLAGESWQQGQVILSWDDVLAGAADPHDGRNVVIHEFAHQIDQDNGRANGAPWVATRGRRERWAAVMSAAFTTFRNRPHAPAATLATELQVPGAAPLIDDYARTDPAEFFAVLSEVFFERPAELATQYPAVFAEFVWLYRANPLHWQESSTGMRRTDIVGP